MLIYNKISQENIIKAKRELIVTKTKLQKKLTLINNLRLEVNRLYIISDHYIKSGKKSYE